MQNSELTQSMQRSKLLDLIRNGNGRFLDVRRRIILNETALASRNVVGIHGYHAVCYSNDVVSPLRFQALTPWVLLRADTVAHPPHILSLHPQDEKYSNEVRCLGCERLRSGVLCTLFRVKPLSFTCHTTTTVAVLQS
jgi:hypothetical protein